jgi:hypothetical protein
MKLPMLVARHRFSCSPRNLPQAFLLLLSPFSMLALQAKVAPQPSPREINQPAQAVGERKPECAALGLASFASAIPPPAKSSASLFQKFFRVPQRRKRIERGGDEILSLDGRKVAGGVVTANMGLGCSTCWWTASPGKPSLWKRRSRRQKADLSCRPPDRGDAPKLISALVCADETTTACATSPPPISHRPAGLLDGR